jgi:hypothetical protein
MKSETVAIISAVLAFVGSIVVAMINKGLYFQQGSLSAGVVFCALVLFLAHLHWKKIKCCRIDLSKHPFFNVMNYYRTAVIPAIHVQNPLKRKLVIKFLDMKFRIFQEKFQGFSKLQNMTVEDFIQLVCICIDEYEKQARAANIPDLFLDKFRDFHRSHTELCFKGIERIQKSAMLQDADKISAAFNILTAAFDITIIDCEDSINSLNGTLEKLLEKGGW